MSAIARAVGIRLFGVGLMLAGGGLSVVGIVGAVVDRDAPVEAAAPSVDPRPSESPPIETAFTGTTNDRRRDLYPCGGAGGHHDGLDIRRVIARAGVENPATGEESDALIIELHRPFPRAPVDSTVRVVVGDVVVAVDPGASPPDLIGEHWVITWTGEGFDKSAAIVTASGERPASADHLNVRIAPRGGQRGGVTFFGPPGTRFLAALAQGDGSCDVAIPGG